jgi:hypothetical protein
LGDPPDREHLAIEGRHDVGPAVPHGRDRDRSAVNPPDEILAALH